MEISSLQVTFFSPLPGCILFSPRLLLKHRLPHTARQCWGTHHGMGWAGRLIRRAPGAASCLDEAPRPGKWYEAGSGSPAAAEKKENTAREEKGGGRGRKAQHGRNGHAVSQTWWQPGYGAQGRGRCCGHPSKACLLVQPHWLFCPKARPM